MCAEEIEHLLSMRNQFAKHNFELTFIVKDDWASETAAEFVDDAKVYVDKELGFYKAFGFVQTSKVGAFAPDVVFRSFRAWVDGHAPRIDTKTDGLVHGGVIVVAPAAETESGVAEILFEKPESFFGDTLRRDPVAQAAIVQALERFSLRRNADTKSPEL